MPPKKSQPGKKSGAAELRRQAEARWNERKKKTGPLPVTEAELRRLVHELQVHQIELKMQNEELVQVRAELEAALRRYSDLYDFAPIGYFSLARDGAILRVNLAGATLLGIERGGVVGQRFALFVSEEFRPEVTDYLEKVFDCNHEEGIEVALGRTGGKSRWVHIIASCSEDGQECRLVIEDISEQKQADNVLRDSEKKYRLLFENVMNGFALHEIVLDEKGKPVDYVFLEVNKAFEQLTGKKRKDLIGKRVTEALPGTEKDPADWIGIYGQVALTGQETRFEQFSEVLGKWFAVLAFSPCQNQFATIFEDITDRVQADKALLASETKFRNLFNNAEVGMFRTRLDGSEILDMNDRFIEIFGRTRADLQGSASMIHWADPREREEMVRQLQAEGHVREFDCRMLTKQGEVKRCLTSVYLHREEGILEGSIIDITERVQAQDELEASEEKFRTLVEQLPAVVYINPVDDPSHTTYVSPNIRTMLGYTQEEWLQDPKLWSKRLHLQDRKAVVQAVERMRKTGVAKNVEYRILDKQDHVVWIQDLVAKILGPDGKAVAWQGLMLDITERIRAEEGLRESEEKYRSLFTNIPDGVYRTTPDGKILTANPALVDILACDSQEELLQKSVYDFYPEKQDRDAFVQKVNELDEVVNVETTLRRKDGELIVVLENFSAVRGADGQIKYYEGTMTDITKVKQTQDALAQHAEELERLFHATDSLLSATPLNVEQQAHNIVNSIQTEFDHTNCSIIYRDDSTVELKRIAVVGPYSDQIRKNKLYLDGVGLVPKAIRIGQLINAKDVSNQPDYVLGWEAARSELVIPLKLGEKVIGALDIQSVEPAAFDEDDERLLSIYADRAVEALENARLNQKTERNLKRILSLRAVDMAISSSFDLSVVLDTLLGQLTTQLSVDAADILLYDRYEHSLKFSHGRGFKTQALRFTKLKPGEGHAGKAMLENKTVHIADLDQDKNGLARSELLPEEGFVAYWGVPLVAKGQTKGVLEVFHRQAFKPAQEWLDFLEVLAGQAAIAIDSAELYENLQRANAELSLAYDSTLEGWANALELRDKETEGHARRVTERTLRLADAMGVKGGDLLHIRRGALLHDIGKMGVPDEILLKPGPLTDEEWVIMRKHPEFAYNLLSPISYLRPALDIPYCHHEKWDGTGYPRGLKGEGIPLAARIFAVVDVWDALRSDRPYRKAWSRAKAMSHLRELAGVHFDPQVVEIFIKLDLND